MKLAIMQPYFLPYIGYFQLINAVDKFVIYDDVNYIKQGWINRNRILLNGKDHLFTISLLGASSFKKINEIIIKNNFDKTIKTIEQGYKKAPYFDRFFPMIIGIFRFETLNLSEFVYNSIKEIANYLDIKTDFVISSKLEKDDSLRGQDKVIHICKLFYSNVYINSIGGQNLYSRDFFRNNGIELKFLKTNSISYQQFNNTFIPNLSIIDMLMFNSKERVVQLLEEFTLL